MQFSGLLEVENNGTVSSVNAAGSLLEVGDERNEVSFIAVRGSVTSWK